ILLSGTLTASFNRLLALGLTRFSPTLRPQTGSGFWRGFVMGCLISIVWTPCAGPILAAVIVQIATLKSNFFSVMTLFAFAVGAALPMLLIALWGQQVLGAFKWFSTHALAFRRFLGLMILATVAALIQPDLTDARLPHLTQSKPMPIRVAAISLQQGVWEPYSMPVQDFGDTWFNSKPLDAKTLQGKVVLIDFWTYSCINCLRTLPEINNLYSEYRDKGLVVIGVHTPEFEFEKNPANVRLAIERLGVMYPVVLDNQFNLWQAFKNHYWPAQYLVDASGRVVYEHFGEGGAAVLDNNIRFLLHVDTLPMSTKAMPAASLQIQQQTPETYLGFARSDAYFRPEMRLSDKSELFTYPKTLSDNAWGLSGQWRVHADCIESMQASSGIRLHFYAHKVFAVMGPVSAKPVNLTVLLNGKAITKEQQGKDVIDGHVLVDSNRLYDLVRLQSTNT
ncbi:MAG: hypothetical protein B7X00_01265, partial [Legionella sp. 21-45-4]